KRVSKFREDIGHSQDCLLEGANGNNTRSVSGKTLVTSTSQSSLLQDGIAALNIPWNMANVFRGDSGAQPFLEEYQKISMESMQLSTCEADRAAKAAAKKAKMEENARLHEAKIRAADEKATRRSKRTSTVGRAGEMASHLAASV